MSFTGRAARHLHETMATRAAPSPSPPTTSAASAAARTATKRHSPSKLSRAPCLASLSPPLHEKERGPEYEQEHDDNNENKEETTASRGGMDAASLADDDSLEQDSPGRGLSLRHLPPSSPRPASSEGAHQDQGMPPWRDTPAHKLAARTWAAISAATSTHATPVPPRADIALIPSEAEEGVLVASLEAVAAVSASVTEALTDGLAAAAGVASARSHAARASASGPHAAATAQAAQAAASNLAFVEGAPVRHAHGLRVSSHVQLAARSGSPLKDHEQLQPTPAPMEEHVHEQQDTHGRERMTEAERRTLAAFMLRANRGLPDELASSLSQSTQSSSFPTTHAAPAPAAPFVSVSLGPPTLAESFLFASIPPALSSSLPTTLPPPPPTLSISTAMRDQWRRLAAALLHATAPSPPPSPPAPGTHPPPPFSRSSRIPSLRTCVGVCDVSTLTRLLLGCGVQRRGSWAARRGLGGLGGWMGMKGEGCRGP